MSYRNNHQDAVHNLGNHAPTAPPFMNPVGHSIPPNVYHFGMANLQQGQATPYQGQLANHQVSHEPQVTQSSTQQAGEITVYVAGLNTAVPDDALRAELENFGPVANLHRRYANNHTQRGPGSPIPQYAFATFLKLEDGQAALRAGEFQCAGRLLHVRPRNKPDGAHQRGVSDVRQTSFTDRAGQQILNLVNGYSNHNTRSQRPNSRDNNVAVNGGRTMNGLRQFNGPPVFQSMALNVCNIPFDMVKNELHELFARVGQVDHTEIFDACNELNQRCGFLIMGSYAFATKAIRAHHGSFIRGHQLHVSYAKFSGLNAALAAGPPCPPYPASGPRLMGFRPPPGIPIQVTNGYQPNMMPVGYPPGLPVPNGMQLVAPFVPFSPTHPFVPPMRANGSQEQFYANHDANSAAPDTAYMGITESMCAEPAHTERQDITRAPSPVHEFGRRRTSGHTADTQHSPPNYPNYKSGFNGDATVFAAGFRDEYPDPEHPEDLKNLFFKSICSVHINDTEAFLNLCAEFGSVASIKLMTTPNGRSKCHGFVEYSTEQEALACRKALNGTTPEGWSRPIQVFLAETKEVRERRIKAYEQGFPEPKIPKKPFTPEFGHSKGVITRADGEVMEIWETDTGKAIALPGRYVEAPPLPARKPSDASDGSAAKEMFIARCTGFNVHTVDIADSQSTKAKNEEATDLQHVDSVLADSTGATNNVQADGTESESDKEVPVKVNNRNKRKNRSVRNTAATASKMVAENNKIEVEVAAAEEATATDNAVNGGNETSAARKNRRRRHNRRNKKETKEA